MLSESTPLVDGDACISRGFHKVHLLLLIELEYHGHMVVLAPGEGPGEESSKILTLEQEEITGIGLFYKLLLTHIIQFPGLFAMESLGIDFL
jgi:hypothetical protein